MRTDFWQDSVGAGKLHGCRWMPEVEPKAVLQIVHGVAEFVERYDAFAEYLKVVTFKLRDLDPEYQAKYEKYNEIFKQMSGK